MRTIHNKICLLLTFFIIGAIAGCAATPSPTYYQLEEPAGSQLGGVERGLAIGLELLNVAAYLDRPQIVTRITDHKLKLSEANMWAEPLKKSIVRVIGVNLSNMLESNRVFRLPRRDKGIPLDFRVTLSITRFDGTLGGAARLTARWTLYNQKNIPILTKVSIISKPAGGSGYDDLIAAQNLTLQDLSHEIGDAIGDFQAR